MQRNSGNTSKQQLVGSATKLASSKRNLPPNQKIKLPSRPSALARQQLALAGATAGRHHQQSSTPPGHVSGAPTSLANLAQLSGITLMPVASDFATLVADPNKAHAGQSNKQSKLTRAPSVRSKSPPRQAYNLNALQLNQLVSTGIPDLACGIATNLSSNADIWRTNMAASTSTLATNFSQLSSAIPDFNLMQTTKPSRATQKHTTQSTSKSSGAVRSTPKKTTTKTTATSKANNQNQPLLGTFSRASFNQITGFNPHRVEQNATEVQLLTNVSSVSNNEPQVSDLSLIEDFYKVSQNSSTSRDTFNSADIDSMPFNPIVVPQPTDEDANNISLIKLMAILNNPALTITAVNNNSDNNANKSNQSHVMQAAYSHQPTTLKTFKDNYYPSSSPSKVCAGDNSQLTSITVSPLDQPIQSHLVSNNHQPIQTGRQKNLEQQRPNKNTAARLPQSATNIQQTLSNAQHSSQYQSSISDLSFDTVPRRFGQIAGQKSSESSSASSIARRLNKMSNLLHQSNVRSDDHSRLFSSNSSWLGDIANSNKSDKLRDPTLMSTSVRNLMLQDLPCSSAKDSTVSAHLLRHIANQNQIDDRWSSSPADMSNSSEVSQKSILEPECILSVPREVPKFNVEASKTENLFTVTSNHRFKPSKRSQIQTRTSRRRLYIPDENSDRPLNGLGNMEAIEISELSNRRVYVSEQYFMLDSMLHHNRENQKDVSMNEPDEIFVNRSKRVMSKIDTMIERKKRRRFERISGREARKTSSLEEQCADSEDEWSLDEQNSDLERASVIKTQFPLQETMTEGKRNHMMSVGLVSRDDKNKILVERCEERIKIFTPFSRYLGGEPSPDLLRLVDTMLKTGGIDVQLRTETSIKRNDLPLIEGLNRNTSRMKMNYMNSLGLEKRSKRTTLYKVKSGPDNSNVAMTKPVDLNKNNNLQNMDKPRVVEPEVTKKLLLAHNRAITTTNHLVMPNMATHCRDAVKLPNKNDYMKSLGLMAS